MRGSPGDDGGTVDVTNEPDQTWELMWSRFLREAAQLAAEAASRSFGEIAKSAASIVLARASWDAFTSEFIE